MSDDETIKRHYAYVAMINEHELRNPPRNRTPRSVVTTHAMNAAVTLYNNMINGIAIQEQTYDNALQAIVDDQETNPSKYPNYPSNRDYDQHKYIRTASGRKYRRTRKHRKARKARKSRKTRM